MYGIESGTINEISIGSIALTTVVVAVAGQTAASKSHDSQDKEYSNQEQHWRPIYPLLSVWVLGSQKECVPTVIIKDTSFKSLKETLLALKKNGIGNSVGRVALVCLLSLIIKVGATEYILQLSEFSSWAKSELSLKIIPFISPFPTGFPNHTLILFNNSCLSFKQNF